MSDNSRQEFETWLQTKFDPILRRDERGDYISVYVQIRWDAWQASRATGLKLKEAS